MTKVNQEFINKFQAAVRVLTVQENDIIILHTPSELDYDTSGAIRASFDELFQRRGFKNVQVVALANGLSLQQLSKAEKAELREALL